MDLTPPSLSYDSRLNASPSFQAAAKLSASRSKHIKMADKLDLSLDELIAQKKQKKPRKQTAQPQKQNKPRRQPAPRTGTIAIMSFRVLYCLGRGASQRVQQRLRNRRNDPFGQPNRRRGVSNLVLFFFTPIYCRARF